MPWVKVDDHFDEHPKMAAVGPVGWGVWLAGLAYCNRNLTDGFIPRTVAKGIGGEWDVRVPVPESFDERENGIRSIQDDEQIWTIDIGSGMHGESITTEWVIGLLVNAGLWVPVKGGYRIHDFEHYQPSKAAVLAERKAWAEKKAKLRAVSRGDSPRESQVESRGSLTRPVPVPVPSEDQRDRLLLRRARAKAS